MSAFDDEQLLEDEDEEMPATERDLADDAQWKLIQKNTFTRWANEHLKTVNKQLADLEADLCDGLRLIGLVEVLSGKKFKHVNRRPNFRTQKLENVTMVLEFLERDEGIRIVNIDSADIVDKKLKLILGLIWTLILHYSISMPMWEGEEPQPSEGGPTPKQRLLNWIQGKVPDLPIKNLTTDFNDGRAIGALVDALAPGLCPDWEDWDPKKAKQNAKEAMDAAEKWLDVPQLIKPEEMNNPKVDDLSMMTYLSQFPQAKLKPGAPLRPKLNAGKVRAYGPGVEPKGNMVGAPAKFTVETFSAGKGTLELLVLDPKGQSLPCDSVFNKDRTQTYSCAYVPVMEGMHKVIVKFGEKEISKSPFSVKVEGAAGDASKVSAAGPGLEKTGVTVNKKTFFEVFTKGVPTKGKLPGKVTVDAGKGNVEVTVLDPSGHRDKIKPTIKAAGKDGVYLVEYTAKEMGLHSINVSFGGTAIPHSPFGVNVGAASNAKAVYATGRGIQPRGVRVKQNADFKIHTKDAGTAEVKVQIIGPGGVNLNCTVKPSKTEEGVYDCLYIPPKVGQYVINITFGGQPITKSPFRVDVGPEKTSKVIAYGPGLEGGVVNQPACFTVETNGETGALGFSIEGPSQAKIDCKDNGDGSADVTYWPTAPGEYAVHIMCNEEDIPEAPYMAQIQPATTQFDASKVIAKGPGLEKTGVTVGKQTEFAVDTRKAGKAQLNIRCFDANHKSVPIDIKDNKDGTFVCKYTAKVSCKHTIIITYGTVSIPKSPFRVNVSESSKPGNVKVYGPGVEKGVKTFIKTHFKVDCRSAGPGDVAIALTDANGRDVPVKTIDNKDGTFTVEYEPQIVGTYTVCVFFAEKEIPISPIKVKVESSIDLSKVTVKGLETPVKVGEKRTVTINTSMAKKKDAPCTVTVTFPSGKTVELKLTTIRDGYSTTFESTEVGQHKVVITYGVQEVPKSPFTVMVESKVEVGKVLVKGLETPIEVGEERPISINTASTGQPDAPCKVSVTNPKGKTAELPTKKSPEGYTTTFAPLEPGPHKVNVNFAGQEVPKSPFPVTVEPKVNVGAVQVKGLETPIQVAEPRPISVNTTSTGKPDAPCKVSVTNPKGKTAELPIKKTPEGYESVFAPVEPGPHQVNVNFAGKEVPKSPFPVDVQPQADIGKVKVTGLEKPIEVGEIRPVIVDTASSGKPDAPCKVAVTKPSGQTEELPTKKTPQGYETTFAPLEPGPHQVKVDFDQKPVPKSPFPVNVEPKVDVGQVEVLGLETPIKVAEPRPVTIMTSATGKPDAPCKVTVTNPKGQVAELPTRKIPEGYTATLAPQEPGPHKVNVEFNGKEVPKSPFSVNAETPIDFSKVVVSGLEEPVEVGEIRPVTVDTASCGKVDAPCQLVATNPVGEVRELPVEKTPKGYQATFAPLEPGPHQVAVKYDGQEVPKSPFPVNAVPAGPPAKKVKAYGPGLEKGTADQPAQFTIDTREVTQPGGLGVTVEGPAESKIECRDNQDGTCDVTYYPTVPGEYTVNVTYAEEHITDSPFKAVIMPSGDIDVSKVTAYGPGLEPGVFLDSPTGFTVDAKSVAPKGEGKVRAIVTTPSGQKIESMVKNKNDGTYDVLYTPYEQGPNTLDITYEDIPIPQSPCRVDAQPGCDASRVKAYGPGLEGGVTDTKQVFTVDVKGAGQGGLALAIDGPAETQINCKDNRDGTCEVEYLPVKAGDYDVTIKFADQDIPGSPFNVKVKNEVNPAKVKCYGPGLDSKEVKAGAPATFTVDTTEAGEAPLEVTYTDRNGAQIPAEIVPVTEGKVNATYYPVEEGKCRVDVKYADQHVPNSPFNMLVQPGVDASKVRVIGLNPDVDASMPVTFTIDCVEAGQAELDVLIQRPDGTLIRPAMQDNGDGTFTVQYTPEDIGPYNIQIEFGNEKIPGSPMTVNAVPCGDATKCRITEGLEEVVVVNKETTISVDASQAGTGKVTCRIRGPSGTDIDIDIVENPNGTFSILFTPAYPGDYSISIKFGGQSIPEGDYSIQVGEDLITQDQVDTTQSAAPGSGLFQPVDFRLPVGPISSFCTAYVVMPSGRKAYPKIEDNKDGSVTLKYQPQETGLHELHVCYNQEEIQGSPFQFHVDAVNSGYVTAYGPGLSHGVTHEPAEFTIVTKDAGAGGLSLAIEGPSKTEIQCKDNEDGTCTVTYLPTAPGEYNITVKFADKHISGSPFTSKITPGEPRQRAQIGRSSEVSLKVTETDITNLTATIQSPSGQEEPCMLKRLPNGHLGISFTPRETGVHLVNVYRDGTHIANSPFQIKVGESELGNAGKVRVYGKGLEEGMANEVNEFIVDTKDAGYGGLSLSIEGPSKADIECHDNEDNTCRVTYKPTEPGTYIINIKFADEHVAGSPFKVKIGGEPSSRITERIMRHQEAVDVTHIGSQCELSLKIPGTSPFDMTASVTNPSGITELCDVVSLDDCHYSIKFVPNEMGVHTVSVKHKEMHIPGSPFQFTVGPIAGGGAHKVHAAGLGLVRGEVDMPCDFNIYTREGGAGGLSIAVEGPSKADINFEDRKDGSCGVTYNVSEPGEYLVTIKFNDEHIPDSPFRVPVTPSIGDARKLSVSALQNKGLQVGKPCAFVVNFNGAAKGNLQARVVTPSGTEEDCLVQEIDDGQYAIRFIPRENGPHLVYVTFDGCQIPDSPFRIQVGTVHADPGMVQAYGDGLKQGRTGETCKFIVNTVNAGSGALAVTVEGPSKVKLECKEVDDGYEFLYSPTAPGDYLITIKYAGTNIAGSPFKAKIEGQGKPTGYQEQASVVVETVTKTSVMSKFAALQPFVSDAQKCTVEGNGLKKAFRNKQSTFSVDTSNAGNNMLFVGMMGPKGPCEELCVKHHPGNPYKINYVVKERGDYMLVVKWGEENIPGSPFYVRVD